MGSRKLVHLLFIAKDTSSYIDRNYSYLEEALAERVHVTFWRKSGHIQSILKQIPTTPDFILIIHDIGERFEPGINGLSTITIPSAVIVNDVHRFTEKRRQFFRKNKTTFVFSVVRNACLITYPELAERISWLPHFVEPSVFKDYQLQKEYDLLMLGAIGEAYPFRNHILKTFTNHPQFVYRPHPGYVYHEAVSDEWIGKRYAIELNKAKLFLTCPSKYNYPVKKYYEALACRTLLMAPSFKELEDLGFIPGTHFVEVEEGNIAEAASYYLHHQAERELIAGDGYAFIHRNHSTAARSEQLINQIDRILNMKEK